MNDYPAIKESAPLAQGKLPLGGEREAAGMNSVVFDEAPHLHGEHDADQPYQDDKRRGHEEDEDVFHGLGPAKHEVAQPADSQPHALAFYLEPWRELYERRERGISPRNLEEVIGHGVDAGTHGLPSVWESSDSQNQTSPTASNAAAGEDERAERLCRGNE